MALTVSDVSQLQPNLTPILDMVFQLITFFMLVINFKSASLEHDLKLPVIGSARPADTGGRNDLLVLNVRADGQLVVYGQPKEIDPYIAAEAQASQLVARRTVLNFRIGDELPSMVIIRADGATPFKVLNRIITTCQSHGFRWFSLKAMNQQE